MKKLAIGCLAVLVVLAVIAAVAGYFVYSKARSYVQQFQGIAALDKNVANTAPFTPPAGGELTEEMVRRFVAVQESMHARLGARIEQMKARQDEFLRRQQAEQRQATTAENFTVIKDMMSLILEAKTAQVDGLNAARFSLDEYYWVRGQVYAAAGLPVSGFDLRALAGATGQGGDAAGRPPAAPPGPAPDRNKQLVAPYLPKLKDWAVLAFFGF